ncbi:ABC transporter permease [Enterococcus ratti]|uniref:Permease n=1 Tax=Enterococcus ratti TaxID=150033 RepID=A0A1L8WPK2_9ENTE|nr:FtsX-like permease family protein [Enterococcus ratti]OJG82948.1 hypothetical protein RV14_GL001950 [Enterococcus ratti]
MKLIDVIRQASTNLWRNKGRTILTIVAIFIGTLTITITIGIKNGVNDYVDRQINSIGKEDVLAIAKDINGTKQSSGPTEYSENSPKATDDYLLTKKQISKIEQIKDLKKIKPIKDFKIDYIQGASNKKYQLNASSTEGIDVDLKVGRQVSEDKNKLEIVIASDYVKSLGYSSAKNALNKKVKLGVSSQATQKQQTLKATIVGVRNPSLINNGNAVVNDELVDKLVTINQEGIPESMKNQYDAVIATVEHPNEKKIEKIKDELANQGLLGVTFADQVGMMHQTVDAVIGVLTIFGAIALLAASFGIINTLYMSVQDRTRDIGLMKAMGMSKGKVFFSFSVEALLIGFWGSLLGCMVAWLGGNLLNKLATDSFLQELDGFNLVQFTPLSIITIMGIIMLIAFLAGTLPANRAARLDPINALRYE